MTTVDSVLEVFDRVRDLDDPGRSLCLQCEGCRFGLAYPNANTNAGATVADGAWLGVACEGPALDEPCPCDWVKVVLSSPAQYAHGWTTHPLWSANSRAASNNANG